MKEDILLDQAPHPDFVLGLPSTLQYTAGQHGVLIRLHCGPDLRDALVGLRGGSHHLKEGRHKHRDMIRCLGPVTLTRLYLKLGIKKCLLQLSCDVLSQVTPFTHAPAGLGSLGFCKYVSTAQFLSPKVRVSLVFEHPRSARGAVRESSGRGDSQWAGRQTPKGGGIELLTQRRHPNHFQLQN